MTPKVLSYEDETLPVVTHGHTWGRLTKSKAHLLMHGNERIWYLVQMTKYFKFKSLPNAQHNPYLEGGWGLTSIGALMNINWGNFEELLKSIIPNKFQKHNRLRLNEEKYNTMCTRDDDNDTHFYIETFLSTAQCNAESQKLIL